MLINFLIYLHKSYKNYYKINPKKIQLSSILEEFSLLKLYEKIVLIKVLRINNLLQLICRLKT